MVVEKPSAVGEFGKDTVRPRQAQDGRPGHRLVEREGTVHEERRDGDGQRRHQHPLPAGPGGEGRRRRRQRAGTGRRSRQAPRPPASPQTVKSHSRKHAQQRHHGQAQTRNDVEQDRAQAQAPHQPVQEQPPRGTARARRVEQHAGQGERGDEAELQEDEGPQQPAARAVHADVDVVRQLARVPEEQEHAPFQFGQCQRFAPHPLEHMGGDGAVCGAVGVGARHPGLPGRRVVRGTGDSGWGFRGVAEGEDSVRRRGGAGEAPAGQRVVYDVRGLRQIEAKDEQGDPQGQPTGLPTPGPGQHGQEGGDEQEGVAPCQHGESGDKSGHPPAPEAAPTARPQRQDGQQGDPEALQHFDQREGGVERVEAGRGQQGGGDQPGAASVQAGGKKPDKEGRGGAKGALGDHRPPAAGAADRVDGREEDGVVEGLVVVDVRPGAAQGVARQRLVSGHVRGPRGMDDGVGVGQLDTHRQPHRQGREHNRPQPAAETPRPRIVHSAHGRRCAGR
ncbi:MAG: hypothetical protein BWZ02_02840 [Lentisphaerae bacterium ADurb.BinA184]|nr:MAG: hypothetical protein BWZ02_02840 [Lentisphaerae bacterium ADurb.BinA184]